MRTQRTNSELLAVKNPELLTHLESQRRYLLRVHLGQGPPPCPACGRLQYPWEAAGLTIDTYDIGSGAAAYHCVGCGIAMTEGLGFFGGEYFWQRATVAKEQA